MTKQEGTGIRNLEFKNWIRNKLPDSYTGYRVYDIDYVIWRKEYSNGESKMTDIMILEEKNGMAIVTPDQKMMLEFLSRAVRTQAKIEGIKYHGTHLVRLPKSGKPEEGCELDNKVVTEEQLKKFLSFETI